ncbi:hypothetical protein DID88_000560 [Monilinia fructigena]|uniref:ATP-dependent rRNA helicase SPB4-like C-terminal tail domain-containing protein n=1 Tax=Monilinia fructigena TaxID=38457 RepID=A0A395IJ54_9HELO|nr:hypothetical protein DID88_000560 [Monilinia fructigena]
MPELKKWEGDKTLALNWTCVSMHTKDKVREKARRVAMEEAKIAGPYVPTEEQIARKKQRAWSQKHEKQDLKELKREKKKERERLKDWTR